MTKGRGVLPAHRPPHRREPVDTELIQEFGDVVGPVERGAAR